MAKHTSRYLSRAALSALERIGDALLPEAAGMPSFSELGCLEHIDDIVAYAPHHDLKSLNVVLNVLSIVPRPLLRFLLHAMQHADRWPRPLAAKLRLLNVGLRGLLFGLYYSGKKNAEFKGKTPAEVMGFELRRVPRDATELPSHGRAAQRSRSTAGKADTAGDEPRA